MKEIRRFFKHDQPNFIMLLLLVILIPFTVLLVREGVRFFLGAQTANAKLYFTPSQINLSENGTVKLFLDAKSQKIAFVSLEIKFDRNKVRLNQEIVVSGKLRTAIRKTSREEANNTGRARLVLGLSVDNVSSPPSGVFEIAQLSFDSITSDPTSSLSITNSNFQVVNVASVNVQTDIGEALIIGSNMPTPPDSSSSGGANLLHDPSFEGRVADNYSNHGTASYSQATDKHHTGSKSLKIISSQSSSTALTRWFSKNGMTQVNPGKRYEASVWVKTKDVASRAVLTLNFWGPGAFDSLSGSITSSSVTGAKDWQKLTISATSPAAARYARVEMRLFGKGTAWFDDITLIAK